MSTKKKPAQDEGDLHAVLDQVFTARDFPLASCRPYGPDFPDITLVDIVTAQRALLEHLGVDHLVAVIGPSYGGFQAFQWAVTFPDFMDGIVPVTTDIKARDDGMARLNALIARLGKNPNWHGGHYYDHGGVRDTKGSCSSCNNKGGNK